MENYAEAALRHWRDAELLEQNNCVDNADHHYGFAAECAIKKVLAVHPCCLDQGELSTTYKKHINMLWEKVSSQGIQKSCPSLMAILRTANKYQDWNVDQRYASSGTVSLESMQQHKQAASRILGATGLNGVRRT